MSLKCLGCKSHPRTDSADLDFKWFNKHDQQCKGPTRIWSAPPTSFPKEKTKISTRSGPLKDVKKRSTRLRRHRSARFTTDRECTESGEPKLIRSRGVRRDWSFENLSDDQPKWIKRSKTVEDH